MDFDPYVKKTAIAGLLKVFYHDPTTIISNQYNYILDDNSII
jgi:hypothetical protein